MRSKHIKKVLKTGKVIIPLNNYNCYFDFFMSDIHERTPKAPPKIEPLKDATHRPRWSVMIPSYNCIEYLRDTIQSVLLQAPSAEEMQIEVIDDYSSDGDVELLVK